MKSIVQVVQNLIKPYIDNHYNAVAENIAPVETDAESASKSYAVGDQLILGGVLYDVTAPITQGDALTVDTNIAVADDVVTQLASVNGALTNQVTDISDEIADMNNVLGAKNLLPNKATTSTINGVTFTVNADGSVTANGTATANAYLILSDIVLDKGSYILTGCPSGGGANTYRIFTENAASAYDNGEGAAFDLNNSGTIRTSIRISNGQTVSNVVFKPMIRLASIADPTYEPYSMTNQQITPYVQAISNPNLLDNPWFTVNQRGQLTYNTSDYTLDRWKLYAADTTKNITVANGITFDSGFNCGFFEYLEDTITASMLGKEVTLSVLLSDGSIVSSNFTFPDTTPSEAGAFGNKQISGPWYVRMYFNGTLWRFEIHTWGVAAPVSLSIRAVKLELGSVSTLAQDIAPNYQQELAKCQRYFYRFKAAHAGFYFALAIAWGNNTMSAIIPAPCMRSTATITPSNFSDFLASKGASAESPHNISNFENFGQSEQNHATGLVITTSENDLVSGDIYVLKAVNANAYIDFSADL